MDACPYILHTRTSHPFSLFAPIAGNTPPKRKVAVELLCGLHLAILWSACLANLPLVTMYSFGSQAGLIRSLAHAYLRVNLPDLGEC